MRYALPAFMAFCLALHPGDSRGGPLVSAGFINVPAPYPQCHASTLAEASPGHLVAAWFGGPGEGNPGVGIWVARLEAGRWTAGVEAANGLQADGRRYPTWNPVLFQPRSGPLVLFYKVGPSPAAWWGMMRTSSDGGRTWGRPRRLPEGVLGPVKNKPLQLQDGTWLAPSSTEGGGWRVQFERSRDGGESWQVVRPAPGEGPPFEAIQPTLLTLPGGRLQALCRTRQGVIAMTASPDGGVTWGPLTAIALPNPNSGIDALTLADGRQLVVYNDAANRIGEREGNRWPLDVAISSDGLAWRHVLTLESQPRPAGYAYPAVIQTADGLVHLSYTWDRKRIKHVVLDPARL